MKKTIAITATCDTKGEEAQYLKDRVKTYGLNAIVIDTGVLGEPINVAPDVMKHEVAEEAGYSIEGLIEMSRGDAVERMREGLNKIVGKLYSSGKLHGLIAIGGAEGAILARSAMDALPLGVPKLTVSTIASGRHFFSDIIGYNDAMVMHSVIDILGINSISKMIFNNAVAAVAGIVNVEQDILQKKTKRIGISMLGTVTPPIINVVKPELEEYGYEVFTFHANGVGGACMDNLTREGFFDGIIDFAPNELMANLYGGLHQCKSDRMEASMELGIPTVVSPGSSSIIVLSREEALEKKYEGRKRYYHNPEITLVRASREEMKGLAYHFAEKMNKARGEICFLYPEHGFSSQDKKGRNLYDPEGNRLFLDELKKNLREDIPIIEVNAHVNDDTFAHVAYEKMLEFLGEI